MITLLALLGCPEVKHQNTGDTGIVDQAQSPAYTCLEKEPTLRIGEGATVRVNG